MTNNTDPIIQWVQAGGTGGLIVGLAWLVLAFVRGWIVSGASHRAEVELLRTELDQSREETREQTLFLRDQASPLLARTQDVLVKVLEERAWDERARRTPKPS